MRWGSHRVGNSQLPAVQGEPQESRDHLCFILSLRWKESAWKCCLRVLPFKLMSVCSLWIKSPTSKMSVLIQVFPLSGFMQMLELLPGWSLMGAPDIALRWGCACSVMHSCLMMELFFLHFFQPGKWRWHRFCQRPFKGNGLRSAWQCEDHRWRETCAFVCASCPGIQFEETFQMNLLGDSGPSEASLLSRAWPGNLASGNPSHTTPEEWIWATCLCS